MLFQKPKLQPKDYLVKIDKEIFERTAELERMKSIVDAARLQLEEDFGTLKRSKEVEIAELDNKLGFMRSERAELEKPIEYKRIELNQREARVAEQELVLQDAQQKAAEREREAEKKLVSVQDLADELGEMRIRIQLKEKTLDGKEKILKEREMEYLVKSDRFSRDAVEVLETIRKKEDAVQMRELDVQGKSDNLTKREKELLGSYILLNDRRTLLEKGWKELKEKQHGSSIK